MTSLQRFRFVSLLVLALILGGILSLNGFTGKNTSGNPAKPPEPPTIAAGARVRTSPQAISSEDIAQNAHEGLGARREMLDVMIEKIKKEWSAQPTLTKEELGFLLADLATFQEKKHAHMEAETGRTIATGAMSQGSIQENVQEIRKATSAAETAREASDKALDKIKRYLTPERIEFLSGI